MQVSTILLVQEIESAYAELQKLNSDARNQYAKAKSWSAMAAAKKEYAKEMESCFELPNHFYEHHELISAQARAKNKAMDTFKAHPEIGGEEIWAPFAVMLEKVYIKTGKVCN